MLKNWEPEYTVSEPERATMVASVLAELANGQPGDHTVLVGGDILVFGEVDISGSVHLYEARILRSSENHEDQQFEGAAVVAAKASGGPVS